MRRHRLFHISEESGIKVFEPRPSPSYFENVQGDVVFAIQDRLLHNYLLPRDCPRVTFYAGPDTTKQDKLRLMGAGSADYVVAVEGKWYQAIRQATLYCYEFPVDTFVPVDVGAGYYVSYQRVTPLRVRPIDDVLAELLVRKVELRIMPTLLALADEVSKSTLEYSLIRMRNATGYRGQ